MARPVDVARCVSTTAVRKGLDEFFPQSDKLLEEADKIGRSWRVRVAPKEYGGPTQVVVRKQARCRTWVCVHLELTVMAFTPLRSPDVHTHVHICMHVVKVRVHVPACNVSSVNRVSKGCVFVWN